MRIPRGLDPLALRLHEWDVVLAFELSSLPFADRGHKAVAIANGAGEIVACSAPGQLANAEAVARTCLERFPAWEQETCVVTSDPYSGSAHVQDHWLMLPIDDEHRRIGLAMVAVHLADVGGQSFGNFNPWARDVFQEGVRTTPVMLAQDGAVDRSAMEMLKLNSRAPLLVEHDLLTMYRLAQRMADEAGDIVASDGGRSELAKSEAAIIESVVQVIDRDPGRRETPVHNCAGPDAAISVHLRREGDRLAVDLAGSSPQAEAGFVNATLANTRSALAAALADLAPVVANSGMLKPLDIEAPAGSIVNCDYPLATAWSPYHPARAVGTMVKESLADWVSPDPPSTRVEMHVPAVRVDGCREESCPF